MRKVRHANRSEISPMSPKDNFVPVKVHHVKKPLILAGILPKQGFKPLSPGKLSHDYKPHQGAKPLTLVKLHNGEQPHQGAENPPKLECNICTLKFKSIPALNGHKRIHAGFHKKDDGSIAAMGTTVSSVEVTSAQPLAQDYRLTREDNIIHVKTDETIEDPDPLRNPIGSDTDSAPESESEDLLVADLVSDEVGGAEQLEDELQDRIHGDNSQEVNKGNKRQTVMCDKGIQVDMAKDAEVLELLRENRELRLRLSKFKKVGEYEVEALKKILQHQ